MHAAHRSDPASLCSCLLRLALLTTQAISLQEEGKVVFVCPWLGNIKMAVSSAFSKRNCRARTDRSLQWSVQVMNNRAGFAFQQFVDLPYTWAYNGSALINTVLRTTDNNTNPVGHSSCLLARSLP